MSGTKILPSELWVPRHMLSFSERGGAVYERTRPTIEVSSGPQMPPHWPTCS